MKKFIFLYNQLKNDFVLYSEEVNKDENEKGYRFISDVSVFYRVCK